MVSESSGRNGSKGKVASKCLAPDGRALGSRAKAAWRAQTDRATRHSGGVVATARRQGCTGQLEKPSSSHSETGGAEGRITGDTGKSAEGERVAEGLVVAVKRSNVRGAKRPNCCNDSDKKEGNRRMTNAPISLQDLRKRIYIKAKAEPEWRFWGLYVHVCKLETLQEAYRMAKENDGAPGSDGVTFAAIEAGGVDGFLDADTERVSGVPVSAAGGAEEGDTEGRGQESPRAFDSGDSRPRGPGGVEAHPGTDLRGRFSTGVVWLPADNGRLNKRCCGWRQRSVRGRRASSILISGLL
jgi:hypothetical protein